MPKTILAGALAALVWLALPLGAAADETVKPTALAGTWAALVATRDAIASEIESGALASVHVKAEPLPKLAGALLEQSGDLEPGKRARVEGAVKQVARVTAALHEAADRGDATRTRKELSRLDGLLELLRAQYPAGALDAGSQGQGGHSVAPAHGHAAHAKRAAGLVDTAPRVTLRIRALDTLRFEPQRLEIREGVPTRIELANEGAVDHSLVVKTPDGSRDWVHLHALPGVTEAATYQLDRAGTYPVLCTVPGHTEAGMVGELVVLVPSGAQPSTHTNH